MKLHYNLPCAIESPSYHGWISQVYVPRRYQKPALPPSMTIPLVKKIKYGQQFKEDEDGTIIQEHDIISKSDIKNIYTDEELQISRWLWWLNYLHCILSLQFFKILFLINIYFSYLHIVVLLFYKLCFYSDSFISLPQYHVLLYHDWWIALITTKEMWSFINDYCHKKCIILWLKLCWPLLAKLLIFRQCF